MRYNVFDEVSLSVISMGEYALQKAGIRDQGNGKPRFGGKYVAEITQKGLRGLGGSL